MKNKLTTTLLSCAALAAFTPSLRAATTLLDNTSTAPSPDGGINIGLGFSQALVFSTGSTAYNLGSIQFATSSGPGDLTLSLYQADSNSKTPTGSALATETFSYTPDGAGVVEENLTGFSLAANSFYALTFVAANGTFTTLRTLDTTLSGGSSGLTYIGREFSNNGGSSWNGPFTSSTPWMKLTDTATSATSAVPEASTSLGLLALGAGGILTRRRSKRAA